MSLIMKTKITRKVTWDMGHRIPSHGSLCRHPHGHLYVAEVTVEGPVIEEEGSSSQGMVMDFGYLKELLHQLFVDKWDHSFMVYTNDTFAAMLAQYERNSWDGEGKMRIREVPFIPTAENIAAEIFRIMKGHGVVQVTVWETPNCKATVTA